MASNQIAPLLDIDLNAQFTHLEIDNEYITNIKQMNHSLDSQKSKHSVFKHKKIDTIQLSPSFTFYLFHVHVSQT